MMQEFNVN